MKRRKCRRALLFVVMILVVAVIAGGIIVAVSKFTGGGSGVKISAQGSTYVIAIDPGHGGRDTGMSSAAIEEKEADLNICAKLKIMLESQGYQVVMTREDDSYLSKEERVAAVNASGADLLVSVHCNYSEDDSSQSGVHVNYANDDKESKSLAENIDAALVKETGAKDQGSNSCDFSIVNDTDMPAVLVEVGFLDNEADNQRFDECFEHTAQAIAGGILMTLQSPEGQQEYYQIQVGAYAEKDLAQGLLSQLQAAGYPAFLVYQDGLYKVRVGAYLNLDNAAWMEKTLRAAGYPTLLVQEPAVY